MFWTAIALGFLGSLHCAAMCGPLTLALPAIGHTRGSRVFGRLVYNLGRVITYCLLGAIFGLIGLTFALAGLQRWTSILAGVSIVAGCVAGVRGLRGAPILRAIGPVRTALGRLLGQRTVGSAFAFGLLNGLLPCGLVYVACAGAVASGSLISAISYMAGFGLGTVPMMFGISTVGTLFHQGLRMRFQKMIPVFLMVVAGLLILRGMALGIPFISPQLAAGAHCPACH